MKRKILKALGILAAIFVAVFLAGSAGLIPQEVAAAIIGIPILFGPFILLFLLISHLSSDKRRSIIHGMDKNRAQRRQRNSEVLPLLNTQALAAFGSSPEIRVKSIDELFDRRTGSIECKVDYIYPNAADEEGFFKAELSRPISGIKPRDREILRSVYHLHNLGISSAHEFYFQRLGIIWGDGAASTPNWRYQGLGDQIKSLPDAVRLVQNGITLEPAIAAALENLTKAVAARPNDPILKRLHSLVVGDGGDLAPSAPLIVSAISEVSDGYLIVGQDQNDSSQLWGYSGEGSLITVAPPGSGKTQSHVLPNLLTWRGPAVVLDVKGEIYEATSGWRAANVGPVYKFSPLDPENSHAYNPLTGVSSDPDHLWEDSRFVADMLIVPSTTAKDPFWENKARDVLTAAIASIAYAKPPQDRNMGQILDILHGVGWDRFIISLQAATEVPTMARSGRSLGEMEAKTRDGVLQSALASLSAWEGARITRATARSDWQPLDLRSGRNPTVYICINPNEIDSYASLLRVVIAQHIRALTAKLPERDGSPILFILDELPRLRRMPPVEEALEIGRQYGIKLWMFAQSLGQLETAYDNAEGMVGSCALRIFMNPSLHDETAQKLSDDMGYRESVIDGTRVKRVEPQVLAGPDFKDAVIVMASNAPPARVNKHFAYADPELKARMAIPPAR